MLQTQEKEEEKTIKELEFLEYRENKTEKLQKIYGQKIINPIERKKLHDNLINNKKECILNIKKQSFRIRGKK